ncbi:hypothetical protein HOH87_03730 [bacterium]|jgi:cytochrome c-type biogenesis protein|nr:hypothetical protein [bacterium]
MIGFITDLLASSSHNMVLMVGLVFLGGILTSLTPCIFPMIPITFSVITSIHPDSGRWGKVGMVCAYGMGLSLAYVVLGAVAVLSGSIFGSILQATWIKIVIANVFFYIAFSAKGWMRLPQVQFKHQSVNSVLSVVGIGFVTGATMSPCTLPVLAIVLAYASQQSLVMGMFLLWVYAMGFFIILMAIALFGASFKDRLPQSGPWLKRVETVLFILAMAIGEWFLMQAG